MSTPASEPALETRHPSVVTQRSAIAGHGSFAAAPIPAGDVVFRYADPPTSPAGLGTVNHSCDPTLGWADERTLVTLRDVRAGEELATDYALSTTDPAFVLVCHCETYRCRQVVEGDDWRIPQLRQRYAGYWSPPVARLIAESA
ncbi:MAG TPA: SET domain-containing protein-lysine N-methyltransferase [Jatrophihabitans sp.]|nr:SET domain-containing protein-lysine N-methyltransferase [Jatrophihabitans sp.]